MAYLGYSRRAAACGLILRLLFSPGWNKTSVPFSLGGERASATSAGGSEMAGGRRADVCRMTRLHFVGKMKLYLAYRGLLSPPHFRCGDTSDCGQHWRGWRLTRNSMEERPAVTRCLQ